ncbi:MAG: hypothetical protein KC736_04090 [Candidatus Moranbacteria bacterium]|nr:hypothetical protein [Candidatus Moranbacteria bacterium]
MSHCAQNFKFVRSSVADVASDVIARDLHIFAGLHFHLLEFAEWLTFCDGCFRYHLSEKEGLWGVGQPHRREVFDFLSAHIPIFLNDEFLSWLDMSYDEQITFRKMNVVLRVVENLLSNGDFFTRFERGDSYPQGVYSKIRFWADFVHFLVGDIHSLRRGHTLSFSMAYAGYVGLNGSVGLTDWIRHLSTAHDVLLVLERSDCAEDFSFSRRFS